MLNAFNFTLIYVILLGLLQTTECLPQHWILSLSEPPRILRTLLISALVRICWLLIVAEPGPMYEDDTESQGKERRRRYQCIPRTYVLGGLACSTPLSLRLFLGSIFLRHDRHCGLPAQLSQHDSRVTDKYSTFLYRYSFLWSYQASRPPLIFLLAD